MRELLGRFFGTAAPAVSSQPAEVGPEPRRLTVPAGRENPIHAVLDEIGLPWRETRKTLTGTHGVRPNPFYG
ncbi:hypothetical protein [Roseomonas chloroacetimidivorans]|uniref:hypothetical protein n=1 Tax=Roseomonas chloroacetimidivorans TaxID=1766656 RepID=UPI003C78EB75